MHAPGPGKLQARQRRAGVRVRVLQSCQTDPGRDDRGEGARATRHSEADDFYGDRKAVTAHRLL
jgi:hypothetical protein